MTLVLGGESTSSTTRTREVHRQHANFSNLYKKSQQRRERERRLKTIVSCADSDIAVQGMRGSICLVRPEIGKERVH
jgi:hypothetical protein